MRKRSFIVLAVALLVLLSAVAVAKEGNKGRKKEVKKGRLEEASLADSAKTSLIAAVNTALAQSPGTAVAAKLEKEDGKAVYIVKIVTSDHKKVEVIVDATTGAIVTGDNEGKDKDHKDAEEKDSGTKESSDHDKKEDHD